MISHTSEIYVNAKKTLRSNMLDKRDRISVAHRKQASVNVANNFMGNIPFGKHDIIAFYWPMAGEIDCILMAEALIELNHSLVLPVIESSNTPLIFRQYTKGMELQKNKQFHVMEPPESAKRMEPNIIITPLLAFDKLGNRLGYGGGFYDRTLEAYKNKSNIVTVGVAYDFMQVTTVPAEGHDQKLDCVVTDKHVVICDNEGG